jgi:hypothetical protein
MPRRLDWRLMAGRAQERFDRIARELGVTMEVQRAIAFGKQGLKRGSKMCACLPDDEGMAFRLVGPPHSRAMALNGAHLWDPSSRDRPFKDWVYVPLAHADQWAELAAAAVKSLDSR